VPYYGSASSITMRPLDPASRLPYNILRSASDYKLSTAFDTINQRLSNIEEKTGLSFDKNSNQTKQVPTELLEELDSFRKKY
jgi:tRNA U34 5-carboxymethylaminomethyl modifying enzyme MnmG/GidA